MDVYNIPELKGWLQKSGPDNTVFNQLTDSTLHILECIQTNGSCHLKDAIDWLYDQPPSKKLNARYAKFSSDIKKRKDPFFTSDFWFSYSPSGGTKDQVYLTLAGFIYFCSSRKTEKSKIITSWAAYLAAKSLRMSGKNAVSPVKHSNKRRSPVQTTTPPRKKLKPARVTTKDPSVKAHVEEKKAEDRENNVVYIIKSNGNPLFKIGRTTGGAGKRLRQLQTGSATKLVVKAVIKTADPTGTESALHGIFSENRVRGEWFRVNIKQITKAVKGLGLVVTKR